MVGGEDHRPAGDVLAPEAAEPEVGEQRGLEDPARPASRRAAARPAAACARGTRRASYTSAYPRAARRVTLPRDGRATERERRARGRGGGGRLGGPAAARQEGLRLRLRRRRAARQARDPRLELAGGRPGPACRERRAVRRGLRAAAAVPARPAPGLARFWPAWPRTSAPGRSAAWSTATTRPATSLPPLSGNRRALAQATWRHVLFALVLGELERRLNARRAPRSRPPCPSPRTATATSSWPWARRATSSRPERNRKPALGLEPRRSSLQMKCSTN